MESNVSPLRFSLPVFEGPLDLLLHLIRKTEIDIYDIPIAEITRQYVEYIAAWQELNLDIAGEYLVMAATLVEIKARLLLPQPIAASDEEEVDPRAELVQRLLEYQRYHGAVEALREWEDLRRKLFFRGSAENPDDYVMPIPEGALDAAALYAALSRVLASAEVDEAQVSAVVPRRRVSLRMRMAEVLRRVRAHGDGLWFDMLFDRPTTRYEVVLTFLALLELLRLGRVTAEQKSALGEIVVRPVPGDSA